MRRQWILLSLCAITSVVVVALFIIPTRVPHLSAGNVRNGRVVTGDYATTGRERLNEGPVRGGAGDTSRTVLARTAPFSGDPDPIHKVGQYLTPTGREPALIVGPGCQATNDPEFLLKWQQASNQLEQAELMHIRMWEQEIDSDTKNGTKDSVALFADKERLRLRKMKKTLITLNDWIALYDGCVFQTPAPIEITNDKPYNYDTAESTMESYWRAQFKTDVDALYGMCDEDAQQMLRRNYGMEPGKVMKQRWLDSATRISVLLRGHLDLGNETFVLLYIRRMSPAGTNGLISLQSTILRKVGNRYFVTELPRHSPFARIEAVSGVNFYPYGDYNVLLPKFRSTSLPASFYAVE